MILNYTLNQPADLIFDYLTDMEKFVSVHPVIHKIENREEGYLFHETLQLGFFPFSFSYKTIVDAHPEKKRVVMRARVLLVNHIELVFSLSEKENCCNVDEVVHIKTLLPLKPMIRKIFRKQHALLFANIEKVARQ